LNQQALLEGNFEKTFPSVLYPFLLLCSLILAVGIHLANDIDLYPIDNLLKKSLQENPPFSTGYFSHTPSILDY